MNPLRLTGLSSLPIALFVLVLAFTGVDVGMQAANNGTAYSDARENFTGTFDTAEQRVYANVSGGTERLFRGATGVMFATGEWVGVHSFSFGYHNPRAAWWYTKLSPVTALAGIALYGYGTYRQSIRGRDAG